MKGRWVGRIVFGELADADGLVYRVLAEFGMGGRGGSVEGPGGSRLYPGVWSAESMQNERPHLEIRLSMPA